ncbi:hypothetical protein HDV04_002919 [Boothiomyces sp. JEL0838]|nr:hypothetical protein HDV04_002919 [Boothiomyces sp. JEL0838]
MKVVEVKKEKDFDETVLEFVSQNSFLLVTANVDTQGMSWCSACKVGIPYILEKFEKDYPESRLLQISVEPNDSMYKFLQQHPKVKLKYVPSLFRLCGEQPLTDLLWEPFFSKEEVAAIFSDVEE